MFTVRASEPGMVIVSADVDAGSGDELIAELKGAEVGLDDYVLSKVDAVAPIPAGRTRVGTTGGFAWVEVLGEARANSRPLGRYVALMAVAGVIAALGVLTANTILIVGAMAVSPDLLPVCAACVGIVGRRPLLARRSLGTLLAGLTLIVAVAMLLGLALEQLGFLRSDYTVGEGGIGTLAHVDYSTVLVALAAGVAAMLAFETRASAAVGVAISVTTIPASAYLGVAIGVGESSRGLEALGVLAVNVSLLIVAGSATLATQRWAAARSERRLAAAPARQ
jgi:uncharacterized hydrophobic protein (TIGR00271 family)